MAKSKYIVLHKELAPGESFEASVKPEFASDAGKLIQHEMPDVTAPNPDGPTFGMPVKGK